MQLEGKAKKEEAVRILWAKQKDPRQSFVSRFPFCDQRPFTTNRLTRPAGKSFLFGLVEVLARYVAARRTEIESEEQQAFKNKRNYY